MMRLAMVPLLAVSLAACAEYQARQQAAAAQAAAAEAQATAASDDGRCRSYGTEPGSPGYVQCRMNMDNMRAADYQQRRALAVGILLNRH